MKKIHINKEWGKLVFSFFLGVGITILVIQITSGGQLFQGYLTSETGLGDISPTRETTTDPYEYRETGTGITAGCAIAPSGMIHWWDADSVTGMTAIDTVGADNGTLTNGVAIVPGKVGSAFSFDGIDDHIFINMSHLIENQMTIEAWVQAFDYHGTGNPIISQEGELWWELTSTIGGVGGQTTFSWDRGVDSNRADQMLGGLDLNQWRHVAVTFNEDTQLVELYTDGFKQPLPGHYEINTRGMGSMLPVLRIGSAYDVNSKDALSPHPWDGLIDEVSIYNRVLNQTEIEQIYNVGAEGKCK
jgi:hypothetical protein